MDVTREKKVGKLSVDDRVNPRVSSTGPATELNIIQPVTFGGISQEKQGISQFAKNIPVSVTVLNKQNLQVTVLFSQESYLQSLLIYTFALSVGFKLTAKCSESLPKEKGEMAMILNCI